MVTRRSLVAVGVKLVDAVSLAGLGSFVDDDTEAVFCTDVDPPAGTRATIVNVAVVPAASEGRVHVSTVPAVEHDPTPSSHDADTGMEPSESITRTLLASEGPLLVTRSV